MKKLTTIIDNIPHGILIKNPAGVIESINFIAIQMFGMKSAVAMGQNIDAYVPNLTDPAQLLSVVHGTELQFTGIREDNSEFPLELAFTTFGEGDGEGVVWIMQDITLRLAAEDEKRRLEESLRHAQKLESLGTLAGGIAHELNTPIQFVTDNMNFLSDAVSDLMAAIKNLQHLTPPDKKEEIFEKHDINYLAEEAPQAIEQSVEGLTRIAEIVLAVKRFSHPSSSGKEMNDINDIIRTTATVSKNQWKYVAGLDLHLAESLPKVISNAGELNQVFLNLIINAAHAIEDSDKDRENGQIKITTKIKDKDIECRISDNGTGIPESIVSKVFDPFFTTKAPGRGSGQGLSIVHSIVTQSHDGDISIETEPGSGTEFVITFPIAS